MCAVRLLREELQLLQEPGSYVGEVAKAMGKKKVLVKVKRAFAERRGTVSVTGSGVQVNPEGKYVVDIDKSIKIEDIKPNLRVALRNDSYTLHKILPSKVRVRQATGG